MMIQIGETEVNLKGIIAISKIKEVKDYYLRDELKLFYNGGATVVIQQRKDAYIFITEKDLLVINTEEDLKHLREKIISLINDTTY